MSVRLTIDSGIPFGWATWPEKRWSTCSPPAHCGVCSVGSRDGEWLTRAKSAGAAFSAFFDSVKQQYRVTHVYFEEPVYFETGQAVAASGSLVKLAMSVGIMMQVAWWNSCIVELVPVVKWKGQLPKRVVNKRIRELLGSQACSGIRSHAWDAVGIGLHKKGFF